jgi:hypothetical protein
MYLYLMLLARNPFFLLLLGLFVAPIIARNLYWLARSEKTMGRMCFTGHTLTPLGASSHPVIRFKAGKDSLFFSGPSNMSFPPGGLVPVRFQEKAPGDARIDTFIAIWGDTMAWSLFPILVILVLYLTPERLSPLIPRAAHIRIGGKKPFLHIIKP